MNTTYLVYIFGDTDVDLLCWLTEKQNIHVPFPFIHVILGVGGIFVPLTKNSIMETFHQKAPWQPSTLLESLSMF